MNTSREYRACVPDGHTFSPSLDRAARDLGLAWNATAALGEKHKQDLKNVNLSLLDGSSKHQKKGLQQLSTRNRAASER